MKKQFFTLSGFFLLSFAFLTYGQNEKSREPAQNNSTNPISFTKQKNKTGKLRTANSAARPMKKVTAHTRTVNDQSSINLYGVSIYDDIIDTWGIVNFETGMPGVVDYFVDLTQIDFENNMTTSGEFANGYLYLNNGYNTGEGWINANLLQISPIDWTVVNTFQMDILPGDMAFDITANVMFALADIQLEDNSYVSALKTIDLTTGTVSEVVTLDRYFDVLACDTSGQLYGVDENGYFCSIDKNIGYVSQIGNTGYVAYYIGSMNFDPISGRLFWALSDGDDNGKLIEIDTTTGIGTDLGIIGNNAEIVALFSNILPETVVPSVDSEEVKLDAPVYIIFNQDVTAGALANITISPDPGNVSASVAGNQVYITHNDFAYNTEYTVTIPVSAISKLSYDISWTFSTILDSSVCDPITVFPWTEGFEGEEFPPDCWTMIDNDGDGIFWKNTQYSGGEWVDIEGYNSAHAAGSASYSNDVEALTPDNWLITPPLKISTDDYQLKYWVGAIDSDYFYDHYEVMVSTTGTNVTDFTSIYEETLTTADWSERTISLSEYSGQTIYIAFVHNNSEDVYIIRIDDVEVSSITSSVPNSNSSSIILYPNPADSYIIVEGFSGKEQVDVYDMAGKLLIRKDVSAGEKISVEKLAQGLYWAKVNGTVLKMIKR